MSRFIITILTILFTFLYGSEGEGKTTHAYVGVDRCKICHETTEMGNQYAVWTETAHAKAYETLLGEEAAKIAQERGLKTPANEAPECLQCHVTGYNVPDAEFGKKFDKTKGIQCESCHGPGEKYRRQDIMCDVETAKANGLILPKPEDCLTCHNENSPKYKPFDYAKYYPKIEHHKNPDYTCDTGDEEEDEDW
ncbi:MAG: multiheme c-type cytochrome [Fidelibacterota bacterium]